MSSILASIYDQLEAMPVTFTDKAGVSKTATVYSQETFIDSLQTAHMPARVLFPSSGSIAIPDGGINEVTHRISDLLLLEPVAQGTGTKDNAPVMTRAIVAYNAAIGKLWQVASAPYTEGRTLTVDYTTGSFEYPSQSGVYFWGVRFDLTIVELAF